LAGGGYAEYVSVNHLQCLELPDNLSYEEGASLPETFFTVWANVFDLGDIKKNESFLVHGASSGIGVAAVQMANSIGARVFGTAGNTSKCDAVEKLGAIKCINYKEDDFVEVLKKLEPNGIDVILDMVGGDYASKNINILNTEGRYIIINAMKGAKAEIDLMRIMIKRLKITGSTLRSRDSIFKGEIAKNLEKHIWPKIQNGNIKAVIHKIFPFEEASKAHDLLESSKHIGKIILKVN
jgi:NADPH2:quinone reductase